MSNQPVSVKPGDSVLMKPLEECDQVDLLILADMAASWGDTLTVSKIYVEHEHFDFTCFNVEELPSRFYFHPDWIALILPADEQQEQGSIEKLEDFLCDTSTESREQIVSDLESQGVDTEKLFSRVADVVGAEPSPQGPVTVEMVASEISTLGSISVHKWKKIAGRLNNRIRESGWLPPAKVAELRATLDSYGRAVETLDSLAYNPATHRLVPVEHYVGPEEFAELKRKAAACDELERLARLRGAILIGLNIADKTQVSCYESCVGTLSDRT